MSHISSVDDQQCDASQYYPPSLARLDRHYKSFWKLYVTHLLQLKPYPGFQGVFSFNFHPVTKVDILGIVVYRDEREKCYIYGVDDGTGVIQVCQLKKKQVEAECSSDEDELSRELSSRLQQTESESGGDFQNLSHGFSLDDLLHVRGQLKSFRERNEIFAYYLARVTDPMAEVLRMKESMHLYKNCYMKPVRIPRRIRSTVGGLSDEREVIRNLCRQITKTLLECGESVIRVYVQDLVTVPELTELTKDTKTSQIKAQFQEAMQILEEEGTVYKDNTFDINSSSIHTSWKVLKHDTTLLHDILVILRRDQANSGLSEFKGTYYLKVLKLLTRNRDYLYLKEISVRKCLEHLEEQGKIYGGSYRGYYLPFDS